MIRPRKLPSKSLLPTHDEIPPPIDPDALKISFDQIYVNALQVLRNKTSKVETFTVQLS